MNIYEELENAVCENSESILQVLGKMEEYEQCKSKHETVIKSIRNSIIIIRDELAGKKLTKEGRTAIIEGISALYQLLVYRGGQNKRESGIYAHKVYVSSLHMVAIQLKREWLSNVCYEFEKEVYKFSKNDSMIAVGIEENEKYKGMVVERVIKACDMVMMFFMLIGIIAFVLSLIFAKNEYIEVAVMTIMLLVLGVYFAYRKLGKKNYFTDDLVSIEDRKIIRNMGV